METEIKTVGEKEWCNVNYYLEHIGADLQFGCFYGPVKCHQQIMEAENLVPNFKRDLIRMSTHFLEHTFFVCEQSRTVYRFQKCFAAVQVCSTRYAITTDVHSQVSHLALSVF